MMTAMQWKLILHVVTAGAAAVALVRRPAPAVLSR